MILFCRVVLIVFSRSELWKQNIFRRLQEWRDGIDVMSVRIEFECCGEWFVVCPRERWLCLVGPSRSRLWKKAKQKKNEHTKANLNFSYNNNNNRTTVRSIACCVLWKFNSRLNGLFSFLLLLFIVACQPPPSLTSLPYFLPSFLRSHGKQLCGAFSWQHMDRGVSWCWCDC